MPLVVFNQKGGVGKSTIACNLAAISAAQGLRTLLIDLDQQGNSTHYLLGAQAAGDQPTVASFFDQTLSFTFNPLPAGEFVVATPFDGLDVMAASERLDELQTKLESRHKIYKLREALQQLAEAARGIYIDTPPALNFYTRSALIAANRCLIPFDCDSFSRHALLGLIDSVGEIRADHNSGLSVEGIVVNQFQPRASLPQRLVQELRDAGLPVLDPPLSASVKIRESHERCLPMVFLDARHKLAQEFSQLYANLAQH